MPGTKLICLVVTLLISGLATAAAVAQPTKKQESAVAVTKTPAELAERKTTLLEFVDENHPDLKRLLGLLEERKPVQFRKAMRTLSRQYDRLQVLKGRDQDRYNIALRYWKVHSRIEVLSAKIALQGPEKHEKTLRELLRQKQEIRIQLQKYELSKTQERAKRQRELLQRTRESVDSDIEKQFNQIVNPKKKR